MKKSMNEEPEVGGKKEGKRLLIETVRWKTFSNHHSTFLLRYDSITKTMIEKAACEDLPFCPGYFFYFGSKSRYACFAKLIPFITM